MISYKKYTARKMTAAVVLLGSALFNSNAHAIPTMGTNGLFSLVGDPSGLAANMTVAEGSFTTTGIVTAAGYTDDNDVKYDTVSLSAFTLYDVTPGGVLENFALADFALAAPIGVLSGSNEVIGFTGVSGSAATATRAGITITLLGPEFPTPFGGIAGVTFSTNGVVVSGASMNISGDQVIPEPSAIALLGAGMLAFGFVRRRSNLA